MNTLYWAIALIPLAIYLLLIGAIHLRGRPLITNGWRDMLTLGIACAGLIAIGPMQLFFPEHAGARWPGWVWLLMLGLYFLVLLMLILWSRPRLVAYGMLRDQFRDALLLAAQKIDPLAQWHGDVLTVPRPGLQLAIESTLSQRTHSVVCVAIPQDMALWLQLEQAFVVAAQGTRSTHSRLGWGLVTSGLLLLVLTIAPLIQDPDITYAQLKKFILR